MEFDCNLLLSSMLFHSTKRIVFIGNGIAYAGYYVSCIDAYLRLQYPEKHFEIINLGLPSETVSVLATN